MEDWVAGRGTVDFGATINCYEPAVKRTRGGSTPQDVGSKTEEGWNSNNERGRRVYAVLKRGYKVRCRATDCYCRKLWTPP